MARDDPNPPGQEPNPSNAPTDPAEITRGLFRENNLDPSDFPATLIQNASTQPLDTQRDMIDAYLRSQPPPPESSQSEAARSDEAAEAAVVFTRFVFRLYGQDPDRFPPESIRHISTLPPEDQVRDIESHLALADVQREDAMRRADTNGAR